MDKRNTVAKRCKHIKISHWLDVRYRDCLSDRPRPCLLLKITHVYVLYITICDRLNIWAVNPGSSSSITESLH